MSFLHVHKRRVPTQDVYRSVVVGMSAETAILTVENRLALAALPVHGTAFRAGLRRVCRVDGNEHSAPFFQLVAKHGGKGAPSLIEDSPIQAGLLPDIPARRLNSSTRGCRHVGDVQIFENNRSETLGDGERDLVMPVASNAGAPRRESSCVMDSPYPTLRAFLAPRHNALCGAVATFDGFEACRDRQHLTGGQRERSGDAAIYADSRPGVYRRGVFNFAGEGYVPAERIGSDGDITKPAAHRARVAKFYPTDFRKSSGGPFAIEFLNVDLASGEAESIIDALLTRRRITPAPGKEVVERLVKIAQRLLLASLGDGGDPIVFGAKCCQVSGLLDVADPMNAPPYLPLLKRKIVNEATDASELSEQDFLIGSETKLEFETSKDHQFGGPSFRRNGSGSRARRRGATLRRVRFLYQHAHFYARTPMPRAAT